MRCLPGVTIWSKRIRVYDSLIPLSADPDVVWSNLSRKLKQQIRKASKLGVKVRFAQQREEVAHYYRLHIQTYCKKHGVLAQPAQFFYGMWDDLAANGKMQLLLAEYEGQIIAGTVLLVASNSTVRGAYIATNMRYLHLAPSALLYWSAIEWCCEHGYEVYDLGRTEQANEGLMEYKRRWGAIPEPLPYYYYPTTTGLIATSGQSQKSHFLRHCWKQLPLVITGPLGGRLYRHMA